MRIGVIREIIGIVLSIILVCCLLVYLVSVLISSACGDVVQLTQPPGFEEFQKWFGPRAKPDSRNGQLFKATKLLLEEMEKSPNGRDLPGVIASNRCGITPNEWQDVLSVAFSYRIWQEIYLLRGEVRGINPGVTKGEFLAEIARLESSLKAELQKILDGRTDIKAKLDALQKSVDSFAQKIGSQVGELLKDSKEQIRLLNEILVLLKGMDVKLDRVEGKVDQILENSKVKQPEPQPQPRPQTRRPIVVWRDEEESPKSFWAGVGVIEQQRVYTNPFGFVGDSTSLHSWPLQATLIEVGARKFLVPEVGAIEIFAGGGLHKTFLGGVGAVVCIKPLDVSLGIGAMYFSENLVGELNPIKGFGEVTFEGKWVRFNFRVVPALQLFTLETGVKF